jgi:hypothetical protein
MGTEWRNNGRAVGHDVLFIILWISGWYCGEFVMEGLVPNVTARFWVFLGIFAAILLVLVIFGAHLSASYK